MRWHTAIRGANKWEAVLRGSEICWYRISINAFTQKMLICPWLVEFCPQRSFSWGHRRIKGGYLSITCVIMLKFGNTPLWTVFIHLSMQRYTFNIISCQRRNKLLVPHIPNIY